MFTANNVLKHAIVHVTIFYIVILESDLVMKAHELTRQGPRLTLKKVRRENEVPKKRGFNFDGRYLGQMSLLSQKWGIFGTAHA